MAKWLIVDKNSLKVVSSYSSDEKRQFGGPWGDSDKFMHLEVPQKLENASGWTVSYESTVIGGRFIPCKCDQGNLVFKEAYDRSGKLLMCPKGSPLYAQLFEKEDVYGMDYVIRAQ